MLRIFLFLRCWWDWRTYCRFQQNIGAKKSSQPQLRLRWDMSCFSHQARKYSHNHKSLYKQTADNDVRFWKLISTELFMLVVQLEVNNRKKKRNEIVALMIDNDKNCGEKQPSICKLDWNTHSWMMDSWFGSTNDSTFTTILYNSPIPPD